MEKQEEFSNNGNDLNQDLEKGIEVKELSVDEAIEELELIEKDINLLEQEQVMLETEIYKISEDLKSAAKIADKSEREKEKDKFKKLFEDVRSEIVEKEEELKELKEKYELLQDELLKNPEIAEMYKEIVKEELLKNVEQTETYKVLSVYEEVNNVEVKGFNDFYDSKKIKRKDKNTGKEQFKIYDDTAKAFKWVDQKDLSPEQLKEVKEDVKTYNQISEYIKLSDKKQRIESKKTNSQEKFTLDEEDKLKNLSQIISKKYIKENEKDIVQIFKSKKYLDNFNSIKDSKDLDKNIIDLTESILKQDKNMTNLLENMTKKYLDHNERSYLGRKANLKQMMLTEVSKSLQKIFKETKREDQEDRGQEEVKDEETLDSFVNRDGNQNTGRVIYVTPNTSTQAPTQTPIRRPLEERGNPEDLDVTDNVRKPKKRKENIFVILKDKAVSLFSGFKTNPGKEEEVILNEEEPTETKPKDEQEKQKPHPEYKIKDEKIDLKDDKSKKDYEDKIRNIFKNKIQKITEEETKNIEEKVTENMKKIKVKNDDDERSR